MKAVVQRVQQAGVEIDGRRIAGIGPGLLVLVGFAPGDETRDCEAMMRRILSLRIFEDGQGKMNLSLGDVNGELLLVSQFTLLADLSKGNRPSFAKTAASPEKARELYEYFFEFSQAIYPGTQSGVFGADMKVELVNDGPVTMIL